MAERHNNILESIEHSNTQERWAINRVTTVFHESGILPSDATQSKRQAMDANRADGAKTSHDVHSMTPVGWETYKTYLSACVPLAVVAKQEGVGDIYRLTPQMVSDYLTKVVDNGVTYSTFQKNCSAIEKFCECINAHSDNRQDFHAIIDDFRQSAKEALPASDYTTRAYENPAEIIANLPTENMQITAELQYTCGLRVSDACYINQKMWGGENLTVHSKNGQYITVHPSQALAERITAVLSADGRFAVNRNAYDYRLEQACKACGVEYNGTHGFRHNFAQERMVYWTDKGLSYHQALQHVSEEMGHHRPDITEWYLR